MFKNYIFQHLYCSSLLYIYIYRLEIRQITNTQTWINISNFSKKQSFQKKRKVLYVVSKQLQGTKDTRISRFDQRSSRIESKAPDAICDGRLITGITRNYR